MGLDNFINKGKGAFDQHRDQISDALRSEKAEGISDRVLDGAADLAKKIAPDSADAKIDGLRTKADGHLGNE